MKFIILLLVLFQIGTAFADELRVEVNPPKPVVGEVFQVYFRIFTDSEDEPVINFSPSGVEVIGKANQGVSTRTIYANGKLTVTREMTVVYELVASKTGTAYLRDINVQVGPKVVKHPSLNLAVLKEPEVMPDVFVMADVPKKDLFIGEGLLVRYYLYSKVPISNLDVKKYPKLDNFLKRFLQEPDRTERVSVDGQLYLRNQVYAAKLFPEKVGDLKIDSLHLSASYPSSSNPFGAFSMNRDFKTKTLTSDVIKVNVKPLPEPVPAHFTGLIGPHEFQINFGQTKLIVNEPLEVKLTVSGGGALENLEPPTLLKHQNLEEFESNGDLKISSADQATKIFDYTFLAKANLTIPAHEMTLSYFDPITGRYVPTQLNLPEVVAAGGSATAPAKPQTPESKSETKSSEPSKVASAPLSFQAPSFNVEGSTIRAYLPYVNLSLALLSVLVALSWLLRTNQLNFKGLRLSKSIPSEFQKGQFSLSGFTRWLAPLIQKTGKSPVMIIRDSNLSPESKQYFIDLLNANDYKDYSSRKSEMQFKYHAGYFKELGQYIENIGHDHTPEPTGYTKV